MRRKAWERDGGWGTSLMWRLAVETFDVLASHFLPSLVSTHGFWGSGTGWSDLGPPPWASVGVVSSKLIWIVRSVRVGDEVVDLGVPGSSIPSLSPHTPLSLPCEAGRESYITY